MRKGTIKNGEWLRIGKDADGLTYYLQKPSWDCNWYWGCGYLETRGSHEHLKNVLFKEGSVIDNFKNKFAESVLSDDEIYQFLELIKTMYTLREMSDVVYRGGSNFTISNCKEVIKNTDIYNKINIEMLPAIFIEIEKLLS